jgi:phosphoserine phosphatase RsbU/P
MNVIRHCEYKTDQKKRTITDLISNPYSIRCDASRSLLSEELISNRTVEAVGVINADNTYAGCISRRSWLEKIAESSIKKEKSSDAINSFVIENVCLPESLDPLDIWDKDELDQLNEELWFSVIDDNGRFIGLFSSRDLLKYLSKILLKDIYFAGQIQSRINKREEIVRFNNYSIGTFSIPTKIIGGDLVFTKQLLNNSFFFSIFDVSGKGNGASLVSSMIYGILNLISSRNDLVTIVSVINKVMFRSFKGEMFATGIVGSIFPDSNVIEIADLGHSLCYSSKSDGQTISKTKNIPLGIDPNAVIATERIQLQKNEFLMLISDGLVEQENDKKRMYHVRDILGKIDHFSEKSIQEIIKEIMSDFNKFAGLKSQHDDASMILIRRDK